ASLEGEKVYYWRVDEFDALETHKGEVWAFTTPGAVGNPQPANGAVDVQMIATLSWTAADNAASHELYFGADADAVTSATTASPEYVGPKALGAESHDPGGLAWDSSYAWRVDEVYPDGTVKGLVWSFATADFILVDDFESATGYSSRGLTVSEPRTTVLSLAMNCLPTPSRLSSTVAYSRCRMHTTTPTRPQRRP
ncbi:MAG: hypothetical protein ACYSUD_18770, partial [Planctomycetota bacterium]